MWQHLFACARKKNHIHKHANIHVCVFGSVSDI